MTAMGGSFFYSAKTSTGDETALQDFRGKTLQRKSLPVLCEEGIEAVDVLLCGGDHLLRQSS